MMGVDDTRNMQSDIAVKQNTGCILLHHLVGHLLIYTKFNVNTSSWEPSCSMRTNGRMDEHRHEEVVNRFSQFF